MDRALEFVLRSFIRHGTLRLTTAGGSVLQFGDGTGEPIAVRFTTRAAQWGMLLDPELKVGEAYMDGTLVMERGSIADFLHLAMSQDKSGKVPRWARLQWLVRYLWRRLAQFNPPTRARRNVSHHYDLDKQLYALFLDADRQYSCAYFEHPEQSLDDAQFAKKRHIAGKLLVTPDARVLDIGSGWGGMGLYLAEIAGARVTGVTLSEEQLALSQVRADEKGLAGRVEFRLQDYRDIAERFDRIVSVGMFEHVGVVHYDVFFRKCADVLADDGVMLLHSIGRPEGPGITNPWISKYIFPGGYIPALSEVLPAVERAGFLRHRHRNPAAALRGNTEALARTIPGASRRPAQELRRAVRAHVGVLSRGLRDGVPRAEPDGLPVAVDQTARCGSHHPRLHRAARKRACADWRAAAVRRCALRASRRASTNKRVCQAGIAENRTPDARAGENRGQR